MQDTEIVGFANPEQISDNEENEIINMKKKASKKSGGFQSMALSYPVLKGILKRGYKLPTPIQRKVGRIILIEITTTIFYLLPVNYTFTDNSFSIRRSRCGRYGKNW